MQLQGTTEALKALRRRTAKELAAYVLVSAVIIVSCLGVLAAGLSWLNFVKWCIGGIFTATLFWCFVGENRRRWHRPRFWFPISLFLLAHCVVWFLILRRATEWKAIWFAPMLFELPLIAYVTQRFAIRHHK